jgi:quercetin dioxygenase-like cupin family protein
VSTLYAIVSELGMSLDELFAGRGARPRRRGEATGDDDGAAGAAADGDGEGSRVQRAANRTAIDLESGVRWERLTPNPDPIDFLFVVYDVGGSSSQTDQFIRHAGREYGIVLSGSLEVTVGFETYVLEAGDSICFDSSTPHRLRNTGTAPATGVWFVMGRQSDDRAAVLALAGASTTAEPAPPAS